jgi:hypothetical protein
VSRRPPTALDRSEPASALLATCTPSQDKMTAAERSDM